MKVPPKLPGPVAAHWSAWLRGQIGAGKVCVRARTQCEGRKARSNF